MEPTLVEPAADPTWPVHAYPRALRPALAAAQALAWANGLAVAALLVRAAAVTEVRPPAPGVLAELALVSGLPWLAAALARRRSRGHARLAGEALHLVLPDRRVEVPLASVREARPWRLPAPAPGVALRLPAGPFRLALETPDPGGLVEALSRAGVPATGAGRSAAWARVRSRHGPGRLERLLRWLLVPLVPAFALFHSHQVIVFGGPLGEWNLVGPAAWLRTLAGYAAVSLALVVLLAAATRVLCEAAAAAATAIAPGRAGPARQAVEWLCRAVLYAGVPALVAVRFLA